MRFKTLEIYELATENDYEKTSTFENVNITYSRNLAIATRGEREIARISCFDDDPVQITDSLKISGVLEIPLPTRTADAYGYWKLT